MLKQKEIKTGGTTGTPLAGGKNLGAKSAAQKGRDAMAAISGAMKDAKIQMHEEEQEQKRKAVPRQRSCSC